MIKDRLNSTRIVFKGTDGTVVSRFDYAPYGEVIRSLESGDLVSFTYTGQEMDKHLGVMNYNARLYDPSLSRFLSADPMREFHSPYNYVGNNPFSFTDPSGMVGESDNPAFSQDQLSAFYYEFDQNWEGYWAPSNGTFGSNANRSRNGWDVTWGARKSWKDAYDRQADYYAGKLVPEYQLPATIEAAYWIFLKHPHKSIQLNWNFPLPNIKPLNLPSLPTKNANDPGSPATGDVIAGTGIPMDFYGRLASVTTVTPLGMVTYGIDGALSQSGSLLQATWEGGLGLTGEVAGFYAIPLTPFELRYNLSDGITFSLSYPGVGTAYTALSSSEGLAYGASIRVPEQIMGYTFPSGLEFGGFVSYYPQVNWGQVATAITASAIISTQQWWALRWVPVL